MKLLSFHPFSLYANGGGGRILRRLYQGHEAQVTSLAVENRYIKPLTGPVTEQVIYAVPVIRSWMRWYLRRWAIQLREKVFTGLTIRRIRKAASKISYDVLHVVNHGQFSAALCTDAFCSGKKLWVSFHDHYNAIQSPFESTKALWTRADRRLVISTELGNQYQQLFGALPYELITDGVSDDEISAPAPAIEQQPVTIYFAGLLHFHYLILFEVLADALDILTKEGLSFKLILRATQNLKFLNNRLFETEYRPLTLNNAELKNELDAAAILYLPIKFATPDFYRYSLSTKMVGYLGAPGPIFYHGPLDSAASRLLQKNNAGYNCGSLVATEVATALRQVIDGQNEVSLNAKALAKAQFNLTGIQNAFWQHTAGN